MRYDRHLWLSRAVVVFASLGALALTQGAAQADVGGVGFWLPGGMGSLSAVPGQAGWSFTSVYLHLEANAGGGKELQNNAAIVTGLHARADALGFLPAYTFETPVLGGQLTVGAAGVPGNVGLNIGATLTGPRGNQISGNARDERTTFADVYYLATLKWNQGVNNFMWYVLGNIPSGTYDPTRLANLSIGYTGVDSGVGYTYLNLSHRARTLSGRRLHLQRHERRPAIPQRHRLPFRLGDVAIRRQERSCRHRRLCLPAAHRRQRRRREAWRFQGPFGRHRPADRLLLSRVRRIHGLPEYPRLLGRSHRESADDPNRDGHAELCTFSAGETDDAARAEAFEVARSKFRHGEWHVRAQPFWPGIAVVILSMTSLTVKLAALARGGNSLKLSRYFATMACAGTNMNLRCADQSP